MSKTQPFVCTAALVLCLGMAAGAAPNSPRGGVGPLPPLNNAAPAQAAPADAAPPAAPPPSGTPGASLYNGQAAAQAGLTLGSWGGGSAQDSTALYVENGHSIDVITVDDYQGGRITFNTPVNLGEMSPTRYLQMFLHFPNPTTPATPRKQRPPAPRRDQRAAPRLPPCAGC